MAVNRPILRVKDKNGNVVDIPAIQGPPGYTPVRGTDYWTTEDKAAIVEEVLEEVLEEIPEQGVANVTADSIKNALGYTPANEATVPSKTSDLANDSGFITGYTETDPTVPAWAKSSKKPSYTAAEVGADPEGTAVETVGEHNVDPDSHNDIRDLIEGITTRLNALANSDDATLDQMAEVVAYIKANRTLIESITTNKVSVADIVNNLTTNVANKPLSAAQGVALKTLIDAITVPTKLSQLTNDSGFITGYTETDPTVPAWAKAASKPSYTADEVGALPKNTPIPSVVQTTGDSTSEVMSQAAVTKELNQLSNEKVDVNAVQNLTEEQKAQARANIGAVTVQDVLAALPNAEEVTF